MEEHTPASVVLKRAARAERASRESDLTWSCRKRSASFQHSFSAERGGVADLDPFTRAFSLPPQASHTRRTPAQRRGSPSAAERLHLPEGLSSRLSTPRPRRALQCYAWEPLGSLEDRDKDAKRRRAPRTPRSQRADRERQPGFVPAECGSGFSKSKTEIVSRRACGLSV